MQGEELQCASVTERGIPGDRAYGLLDLETGRVASAKQTRLFPDLMACRASFIDAPQAGGRLPPVRIDLPDGQAVYSDAGDVDRVLSAFFRREVRLVRAGPGMNTAEEYRAGPDGDDECAGQGRQQQAIVGGALKDARPMSVLTTSTLDRFSALRPGSRFDARRFRMNVIVETEPSGFIENDWVGRELDFEGGMRLEIVVRDSRCVMTTLAQDDLPHDPRILETVARYNKVQVSGSKQRPCAGVYAAVLAPGTIRTGSRVALV